MTLTIKAFLRNNYEALSRPSPEAFRDELLKFTANATKQAKQKLGIVQR